MFSAFDKLLSCYNTVVVLWNVAFLLILLRTLSITAKILSTRDCGVSGISWIPSGPSISNMAKPGILKSELHYCSCTAVNLIWGEPCPVTTVVNSSLVMELSRSMSYKLKAQFSFSSTVPRDVIDKADQRLTKIFFSNSTVEKSRMKSLEGYLPISGSNMNSSNSTKPSPFWKFSFKQFDAIYHLIKNIEDKFRKFWWVSMRKKLLIYRLKSDLNRIFKKST